LKTYEGYLAELEALKQILKGSMFYLALPAEFFADAKAEDAGYFFMVTPKGMKQITQQKWEEVAGKDDTEKYAMPQISPKMLQLYFENTATYMPERKWKTIANAAKNNTSPARMNTEDQRLLQYIRQLTKNYQQEFVDTVNNRRRANIEQVQKYAQLMAQREAMQNVGQRKNDNAADHIEVLADESPEERVARISRMIAADFGESFTPFW